MLAIAEWLGDGQFRLLIVRDDGREVWGDEPIPAAGPEDMPAAAVARLGVTNFGVVGGWTAAAGGLVWVAPAAVVRQ